MSDPSNSIRQERGVVIIESSWRYLSLLMMMSNNNNDTSCHVCVFRRGSLEFDKRIAALRRYDRTFDA